MHQIVPLEAALFDSKHLGVADDISEPTGIVVSARANSRRHALKAIAVARRA